MPRIDGLLETALYVDDMERAACFYERVMGLEAMFRSDRLTAFDAGDRGVLLVFRRGASTEDMATPAGTIPGHDGAGPLHMAFRIAAAELEAWRRHLPGHGVPIHSEVTWPRGGTSLYFHDPDGHVIELATPGLWANY
ncbi:MAG TPA: VOC family protein [Azospirillaceae bacterium]|nr:VOC family protein [Azospirillaceae bacterium]